jgi:hypothetical protein
VQEKPVTAESAQLERIVQSAAFRTSEIHRVLLAYLVEKSLCGEADSLKEYTVGLEVFRKPPSYDPRQESTVRMHVSRVRQKLADYYQNEGAIDPVVISLPKGAFKISFFNREEASSTFVPAPAPIPTSRPYFRVAVMIAITVALTVALTVSAVSHWPAKKSEARASVKATPRELSEIDKLWEPFLASERSLIVCLSSTSSGSEITGPGTADGAFLLGRFFATHSKDVAIEKGNQLSILELGTNNLVFIGPVVGNRNIRRVLSHLELVLEPNGVTNTKPQAGEIRIFSDRFAEDAELDEGFALITHLPGLNGDGDALYLSGNKAGSVAGAVRALTDPSWARVLVSGMEDSSGNLPRFYQVVLKVRSMDGTPVDVSHVMHRPIDATLATASWHQR